VLWLGDSGMGKSHAQRAFLEEAKARHGMIVVAHDDTKLEPEVPGAIRANVADLEARPPSEEEDATGALCFRGDAFRGIVVEVEEVAAFAIDRLARRRVRTCMVVEELDRAVTPGGRQLVSAKLRECCTQGRVLGLCVSSTTQSPARTPAEILDQATAVVLFRLGPRALNYVDERLMFDGELLAAVPTLERGDFVLHVPGEPWNRTLYRFPPS